MAQAAVKRIDPARETRDNSAPPRGLAEANPASGDLNSGRLSDARGLQSSLEKRLNSKGSERSRWSARRTLAFVLGSSLMLWGMIIWGGLKVVARLAG